MNLSAALPANHLFFTSKCEYVLALAVLQLTVDSGQNPIIANIQTLQPALTLLRTQEVPLVNINCWRHQPAGAKWNM